MDFIAISFELVSWKNFLVEKKNEKKGKVITWEAAPNTIHHLIQAHYKNFFFFLGV